MPHPARDPALDAWEALARSARRGGQPRAGGKRDTGDRALSHDLGRIWAASAPTHRAGAPPPRSGSQKGRA